VPQLVCHCRGLEHSLDINRECQHSSRCQVIDKLDVILLPFSNVSSNVGSDFMHVAVELKICMIHDNQY
jgi:hypothetical protein